MNKFIYYLLLSLIYILLAVSFYRSFYITYSQDFPIRYDLGCYYVSAHAISQGISPYNDKAMDHLASKVGIVERGQYVYPPFWAVFLSPIRFISVDYLFAFWLIINLVLLVISILLLVNIFSLNKGIIPVLVLMPPVYETIFGGNINIVLLFLLCIFIYSNSKIVKNSSKNNIISGIALGLMIGIKVFPVMFLLPLIIHKKYQQVFYTFVVLSITILIGIFGTRGIETSITWVTDVFIHIPNFLISFQDHSLQSVINRLFSYNVFETFNGNDAILLNLKPVINISSVTTSLSFFSVISIISYTIYTLYKNKNHLSEVYSILLIIPLILIITPRVWSHYYVLLIPVLYFIDTYYNNFIIYTTYIIIYTMIYNRFIIKILIILPYSIFTTLGIISTFILFISMIYQLKYSRFESNINLSKE